MNRIPPIKSVMTPFPHYIEKDRSLDTARAMMTELGIRHLPVMDGDRLASVISEREVDLAQDTVSATASAHDVTVGEIVRHGVYTVELTEPLDVVLLHMAREHLDCALIVKEGKLAGIFTSTDASRTFGELLRDLFPRGGGDEAA